MEPLSCPSCNSSDIIKKGRSDNGRHQRFKCRSCNKKFQETTTESAPDRVQFQDKLPESNKYVITAAQNATPVNEKFFNALLTYCKYNKAELIVIPIRYKNPNSIWSQNQEHDEWWDSKLVPYLYAKRKKLNDNIEIMGDIKTTPTAVNPLSGMEGLGRGLSTIFGHPKLQLKTVPTPQNKLPCIMTTTGAVTVKNFTDSKAGKKGEFHYTMGAALVEIESKSVFHLRQINALDDGSFIDWDREYLPNGKVRKAGKPKALVLGDTHVASIDDQVDHATFGKNGIVDQLRPETLVFHDLFDGLSINPHHRGDPFTAYAKRQSNVDVVRDEVLQTIDWLKNRVGKRKAVVVGSNHDDFLKRWLMNTDWRTENPINVEFYLETALALIQQTTMKREGAETPDPFSYWVNKLKGNSDIHCLSPGESYIIADIEHGFHGHKGPNGARGSVNNLSKMGCKVNSGHGHACAIQEGHYRAGTMTSLRPIFTSDGPGSWMNTHIVVYDNGKRSLVNIIGNSFRL